MRSPLGSPTKTPKDTKNQTTAPRINKDPFETASTRSLPTEEKLKPSDNDADRFSPEPCEHTEQTKKTSTPSPSQNTEPTKTPPLSSSPTTENPTLQEIKENHDTPDSSQDKNDTRLQVPEHDDNTPAAVLVDIDSDLSDSTILPTDEEQADIAGENCCPKRSDVTSALSALEEFNSIIGLVTSILSYRTGGGIHENIGIALVWVGVGYWNVFVDTPRCITAEPDLRDAAKQDPNPNIGWGLYIAHMSTFCLLLPATVTATLWLATREFIKDENPNSSTLGPAYLYVLCDAAFAIGQLAETLSDVRNRQLLLTQGYHSASYNDNFDVDGNQYLLVASALSNLFGCLGGISSGWSMVDLKNPKPSALLSIVFFLISALINMVLLGARFLCVVDIATNTCNTLSDHAKAAVNWCSTFSTSNENLEPAQPLISEEEQQGKYGAINEYPSNVQLPNT